MLLGIWYGVQKSNPISFVGLASDKLPVAHRIRRICLTLLNAIAWVVVSLILLINLIPTYLIPPPKTRSNLTKYDAIIVLGNPATSDGEPGAIMYTRVEKAVELFQKRLADKIIVSGNSVYNQFNEATIMAELATSLKIPESAILKEPKAKNSYENAKFCIEILKANYLKSAIVITSRYHLKRASYIFSHYDIEYQIVAADYPKDFYWMQKIMYNLWENWLLTKIYLFGDDRLPKRTKL